MNVFSGNANFAVFGVFYLFVLYSARRRPIALSLPFVTSSMFKGWALDHIPLFATIDYTVMTVAMLWIGVFIAQWTDRSRRRSTPIGYYLLYAAFTILIIAATDLDYDWARRVLAQHVVFNTTACLAPLLMLRNADDARFFLKMLIGFGVFVAIVSLLSPESRLYAGRSAFLELGDPISIGRYCSYSLMLIMGVWPFWRRFSLRSPAWILILALVLAAGAIHTGSRGPLLHLALAIGLTVVLRLGRDWRAFAVVIALVSVFLLIVNLMPDDAGLRRLATISEPGKSVSIVTRVKGWRFILANWDTRLLFGHGIGTIEFELGIQAHSLWLDVLFANGLSGAIALAVMVLYAMGSALLRGVLSPERGDNWLVYALFLVWIYVLVSSTTALSYVGLRMFFVWLSVMLAVSRIVEQPRTQPQVGRASSSASVSGDPTTADVR